MAVHHLKRTVCFYASSPMISLTRPSHNFCSISRQASAAAAANNIVVQITRRVLSRPSPIPRQTRYLFEGFKIIQAGGATLLKIEEYYYCPLASYHGHYVSKCRLSFHLPSRARGVLIILWQCTSEEDTLPKDAKMYKRADVDAF